MVAAVAAAAATFYPLMCLPTSFRAANAGASGSGAGSRTPPRPGGPQLLSAAAARTPPRGAAGTPLATAGSGGAEGGGAAAPDDRVLQLFVMPAARLIGAVALSALEHAEALRQQIGGCSHERQAAAAHAAQVAGAAAHLFCATPHAEVCRLLVDEWEPMLTKSIEVAAAAYTHMQQQEQQRERTATEPEAVGASRQLGSAAEDLWDGVMEHWAGLPVTADSIEHIQGWVALIIKSGKSSTHTTSTAALVSVPLPPD
jgi:hypothetical protein